MGYSLQATAKTVEGAQHPDRNAHLLRSGEVQVEEMLSLDVFRSRLEKHLAQAMPAWIRTSPPELAMRRPAARCADA